MRKKSFLVVFIALLALVTACSAAQTEEPVAPPVQVEAPVVQEEAAESVQEEMADEEMAEPAQEEMADEEMAEPAQESNEAAAGSEVMADLPAWQQLPLTDARSGETFTLADFAGKTVFVEPMATWCSNCRRQLGNVREAKAQLGEDVVFIGLSVETSLDQGSLAQYADGAGFDWTFAVMSPEMLQALVDQFGRAIANPPATPHFIVGPDGSYTDLVTGIDPPDQLIAQIQAAS